MMTRGPYCKAKKRTRLSNHLFAAITVLLWISAAAQPVVPKGKFIGIIRGGLCTSQVHGDGFGGYNKLNGTAAIGTAVQIKPHTKLKMEVGYCGRGSRKRPKDVVLKPVGRIQIHYIDIPVLLQFTVKKFEFEAGLNNSIYLSHREGDQYGCYSATAPKLYNMNRYELAVNAGVLVAFSKRWSGNARFHYSLLPISGGLASFNGRYFIAGVYNNAISFSLVRWLVPRDA